MPPAAREIFSWESDMGILFSAQIARIELEK